MSANARHVGLDLSQLEAADIGDAHTAYLETSRWPVGGRRPGAAELWTSIELNHRHNCMLWDEEDLVRRTDVPNSAIVASKRAINRYNQLRNDTIEQMDEWILGQLAHVAPAPDAWFNSETAGSIIDRLSIASLKVFHHERTALREEAESMRQIGSKRAADLRSQRADLLAALDALLGACACGKAYYRIYRQHKMYGVPEASRART